MKCDNCGKELTGGKDVIEVVYKWEDRVYARSILCRDCYDKASVRRSILRSALENMKKDMDEHENHRRDQEGNASSR